MLHVGIVTWFGPNWITLYCLEFFWYKPTIRRLVPIFYGNLRPAGAKTVWLLCFMLKTYATQQKTSLLKKTFNKEQHHGGAGCWSSGRALMF